MARAVTRVLTVVAAAVLAFDGAALAGLGLWTDRLVLVLIGAVFIISSGLVVLYWRWYRRRVADITAARQAMGDEVREMQRLLKEK